MHSLAPESVAAEGMQAMGISLLRRFFSVALIMLAMGWSLPASANPASGYWFNPAESGRGFVSEIQGSTMFMAGFLYAASGEATWVATTGPMTSATQYSGTLITYNGGQTLTGAYQAPSLAPSLGSISISFSSDTQGSITWPGGTVPIQRFDIVPNGSTTAQPATNPQTGWWWNEQESGRGFAIEVQNGTLWLAGYMYDATGNPTWYLATGPMTGSSEFQGEWAVFGFGQTLTGPYLPPTVTNASGGAVTLQFTNPSVATLTLPDGRQVPFERFNFGVSGFTLQAFAPTATGPAQLLQITGSGLDPAQALTLTLSDSNGYSVTIPPVAETTSTFSVSVPAYINATSGAFGSGTVSLQATQGSAQSNVLTGFQIQALTPATGTKGNATLSLIQASLAEAQKLQMSVMNTPQNSTALQDAIGVQIFNLQQLVTNVQNVVQNGASFSLGAVNGVDITVTQSNISDVDDLIIATLQSLAAPATTGSASKSAQLVTNSNPTCMSAEANAYAVAALTGVSTVAQAQTLIEAACNSTLCSDPNNFVPAYNIFSGKGSTSLGELFGTNKTGDVPRLKTHAAAMMSTAIGNSATGMALNSATCQKTAANLATALEGIASVTRLQQPEFSKLLPVLTGEIVQDLVSGLSLTNIIAPPPPTSATGLTGTWSGSMTVAGPSACSLERGQLTANFTDHNGALTGSWTESTFGSTGTITGVETGTVASWSASGSSTSGSAIFINATINSTDTVISGSFISSFVCTADASMGTISGTMQLTKQ
jgi:hypothetical protein